MQAHFEELEMARRRDHGLDGSVAVHHTSSTFPS